MWGGAAKATLVSNPPHHHHPVVPEMPPLQTAMRRYRRQRGPGASLVTAWQLAPGRWRPFHDLGHSTCSPGLPGWLSCQAAAWLFFLLLPPEVPALKHHRIGPLGSYGLSLFFRSLPVFLGSLSQCLSPPLHLPQVPTGANTQNSRMERILGRLCHGPSSYREKLKPRKSMWSV